MAWRYYFLKYSYVTKISAIFTL